jgi:hypothetical protein
LLVHVGQQRRDLGRGTTNRGTAMHYREVE